MLQDILVDLAGRDLFLLSLWGGLVATLLNMAGASPALFLRSYSKTLSDAGLGFAAGVMLTASFTSLLIPAIEHGGIVPAVVGLAVGALAISVIDRLTPHLHFVKGREGPSYRRLKATWLFVFAITIHNAPEGLALGVGFGSGDIAVGLALTFAIGLQNIPEGLSVAFSLMSTGEYSRRRAFLMSSATGLVEPLLAAVGAYLAAISGQILPYAMGFAAGAMLYVVSDEIIPETHREGEERISTYGLITGLAVMLILDTAIG